MRTFCHIISPLFSIGFLLLLAACGPQVSQSGTQQNVTINKTFQGQLSPLPSVPPYRCGAWSSNNAPGAYSTITIYARLTKDIAPISDADAVAVVHFRGFDQPLDAQAPSDDGGYVTFTLQLHGRQPSGVPATVDVTFTDVPGSHGSLHCTPAFFTPQ